MSTSTLPPERSVNRDVPVVTAEGGTAVAYKDPNSPESIMRRAKTAEVQASVDSKYDTNVNPYEGFSAHALNPREGFKGFRSKSSSTSNFRLNILIVLLALAYFFIKEQKSSLGILSLILFVLVALLYFAYTRTE